MIRVSRIEVEKSLIREQLESLKPLELGEWLDFEDLPYLEVLRKNRRNTDFKRLDMKCIYRSDNFKLTNCSNCRGNVQIKVFNCSLFTECTIRKHTSLIHSCDNCQSRKAKV